MNLGVKFLDRIPSIEIVFVRAIVTLVMGYILIRKNGLNPWGNNKPLLIWRGIIGTAALVIYFYTLQRMPLASAVTIQYLSPIFTIIVSAIFLHERAKPIQWLLFILAFAGVIMIKGFDPRVTVPELLLGITSALLAGIVYNIIRKERDFDHPLVVVFYFPLVTVPIVGAYTAFNWVAPRLYEWLILVMIGLAVTVAQVFMTKAYQTDTASNISIFNYLGSIYAIIFGFVLFGETLSPLAFAGFALILLGVIAAGKFGQAAQPVKE